MTNLEVITYPPKQRVNSVTIVLVHDALHGAWCWERLGAYLAEEGYLAKALSLRGHGASEGCTQTPTMRDYVDDLAHVVTETTGPVILVGHGFGGWIVQRYLETHECEGVVLMATLCTLTPTATVYWSLLWALFQRDKSTYARRLFFGEAMPRYEADYYTALLSDALPAAFADLRSPIATDRITTRILVQEAARDKIVAAASIQRLIRAYSADAQTFDAPHDLMLAPGFEAVADGITDWIQARHLGDKLKRTMPQIELHPVEMAFLADLD